MEARKTLDSKSDLQGHSRSLLLVHWINHIRFPISLPLQLHWRTSWDDFYRFQDIIRYFPKCKEVT